MSQYQIADLEKLTGIKAHTIRIWEKRYNLIEPHRTPTNIRYYDDQQVKKLLNTSTLLAKGMKISKISALSDKEISEIISNYEGVESDDVVCSTYINDLMASMLVYDEPAFDKAISSAINRFGMYNAMLKVIYPFLKKTGLLWAISQTMPVQEHFASCIIRKKLLSAIEGLPPATNNDKKFLLFLAPNEWHELGLMFSDYMIKSKGYQTVYLGPHVPIENLNNVVAVAKPSHVLTFFITRQEAEEYITLLQQVLLEIAPSDLIIVGSGSFKIPKDIKKAIFINSPNELLNFLN